MCPFNPHHSWITTTPGPPCCCGRARYPSAVPPLAAKLSLSPIRLALLRRARRRQRDAVAPLRLGGVERVVRRTFPFLETHRRRERRDAGGQRDLEPGSVRRGLRGRGELLAQPVREPLRVRR